MATDIQITFGTHQTPNVFDVQYTLHGAADALDLSYQSDSTIYLNLRARPRSAGTRIFLNGQDVTRHLIGPITWTRRRDSPIRQGRFALAGTQFLPHQTAQTWTLTPLQLWGYVGPPAQEVERLLLSGYVITADSDPVDRVVTIQFADRGAPHHQADACFESAPLAGLNQGRVFKNISYSAGIPEADAPAGSVITKPVSTQGKNAFSVLNSLADAAGWWLRFDDTTGALRAEDFRLKRAPQRPDEVWHLRELYAPPQVSPPQPVPSRWLVRFTSAVEVDEQGIETTTAKTVVESIYAPQAAVERQTGELDAEGNPVTIPYAPSTSAELRITKTVCEITKKRGDLIIQRTVEEHGWHNPERARLIVAQDGPSQGGFYASRAYVDGSGVGRWWPKERFGLIQRVIETPTYDATGSILTQTRDLWAYSGMVVGLRRPGDDTILNLTGAGIAADGESYWDFDDSTSGRIFTFRHTERRVIEYSYGGEGHAEQQVERVYRHFSPQASVDPLHTTHWVTASGRGQVDLVSPWQEIQSTTQLTTKDEAGRVAQERRLVDGWRTFTRAAGRFDWGGNQRSDARASTWGPERAECKTYVVLSDQHYEVIDQDGRRQLHTGTPPLPQYLASPWTRLSQDAFETVLDDPVLQEQFGFSRRVLQSEWIETPAQAAEYLGRVLDADYAHELVITRPLTQADVGSTIHVIDPDRGIDHRMLVYQVETQVGPAMAEGVYVLRQPLATGVRP